MTEEKLSALVRKVLGDDQLVVRINEAAIRARHVHRAQRLTFSPRLAKVVANIRISPEQLHRYYARAVQITQERDAKAAQPSLTAER